MSKRVVFIPWNRGEADDFERDSGHNDSDGVRKTTHHKRTWVTVYLDDRHKPLASIGLGAGVRLHIAGHGVAGVPTILPDFNPNSAPKSSADVVDGLIRTGLKKRYLGTIACDVCYSAVGTATQPAFGQLLARELWNRGFLGAHVLGRTGRLVSRYDEQNTDLYLQQNPAKYGTGGHKYSHRLVVDDELNYFKAKDAQIRFFGWM